MVEVHHIHLVAVDREGIRDLLDRTRLAVEEDTGLVGHRRIDLEEELRIGLEVEALHIDLVGHHIVLEVAHCIVPEEVCSHRLVG